MCDVRVIVKYQCLPTDGPMSEAVLPVCDVTVCEMTAVTDFTSVLTIPPSSPHTDSHRTEEMS